MGRGKYKRRLWAAFLTAVMLLSSVPSAAYAVEGENTAATGQEAATEENETEIAQGDGETGHVGTEDTETGKDNADADTVIKEKEEQEEDEADAEETEENNEFGNVSGVEDVIEENEETESDSAQEEEMEEDTLQEQTNPVAVEAAVDEEGVTSGSCGENVTWQFADGVLTISGSGAMEDYSSTGQIPWYGYAQNINCAVIEEGVTTVGSRAFHDCRNLKNIEIPSGVTSIGSSVFRECSSLTSIEIPSGVTSIGDRAFWGCSSLASIEIPSGVTSIEGSTFAGCLSLMSIEIPAGVTFIGHGAFSTCISLTSIEIPSEVTSIENSVFMGCSGLTSIEIPSSVTSIGSFAFDGCSSLTGIEIPSGVTSIGDEVFNKCTSLTDIEIPSGVMSIGDGVFHDCYNLKNIEIPSGVTSMGDRVFSGCTSLTSMVIPPGFTTIENETFYGCSGLTEIEIPLSVTTIGMNAFGGCSSLTNIEIPPSVKFIERGAFRGCRGLTSIEIPSSVTSLDNSIFYLCSGLTSIEIPSGVTTIGEYAFYGCSSLTSIEIPSEVTTITDSTFFGCSSLTSIQIPLGVTVIGTNAFKECGYLADVYYSGSESDWQAVTIMDGNEYLTSATIHYNSTGSGNGETIEGILRSGDGWKIRWTCTYRIDSEGSPMNGRVEINVNDTNTVEELYLYYDGAESGLPFPWELEPYNISKSAIDTLVIRGCPTKKLRIAADSFKDYGSLKNIVLEYTSGMDSNAFKGCTSLKSVEFLSEGTGFATIGNGAFENCISLTDMNFPAGLTHIGERAFQNTALGTITLGNGITDIGNNAFSGCSNLIIRCYKDSVAHRYAQANNISFQLITEDDSQVHIYYGVGKTEKFNHNLDHYISTTDSDVYSPQLSHMLIAMSCAVYDEGNVKASMMEMGFKDIACHYSEGDWNGQISYAFGKKTMPNGETLVLAMIRGSSSTLDWISNFTLGRNGSWHAGFEAAVNEVYDSLISFMDGNLNGATYVVTGHSRGAAVANLLEIKLFEAKVANEKVYGYNFACPDVARAVPTMWNWLGEHNNMFNIGNAPDLVTMVPGAYGQIISAMPGTTWGKFGQSRWFSKDWNNSSEITLDLSFSAHGQEIYLNYLKKEPAFDSFKTYEQRMLTISASQLGNVGRLIGIQCPVDVNITDQNGNMVASVTGGEKNYYGFSFGEIMIFTDGDKKAVFVQGDEPLEIHLTATDGGTMAYTVQALNYDLGQILSEKVFENVRLTDGKQMLSIVDTEETAGNGTDVSQVPLYVLGLNESPEKEVLPDGAGTEIPYTGPNEVLPEDIPADGKIPDGLWIAGVADSYTYTGAVIKPEIRVYDGKKKLRFGKDYAVSYKNSTKVNDAAVISTAPTIAVKGKGNYAGAETATFKITPVSLSGDSVTVEDITVACNKKVQKKVPIVTYNGRKLARNKDFTVSYPDGGTGAYKEAGTYDILLTAKTGGNFSGTKTVKCIITDSVLLGKVNVRKIPNQTYIGTAIEPELTVTYKNAPLVKGTDYMVSYTDHTEIGTAQAVLTGIGKYAGMKKVTFRITGISLKGAAVSGIENKAYNGNFQVHSLTVAQNGRTLTAGTDYDVVYADNRDVGKASVTIKGKGAYTGNIKKTFRIEKFDIAANTDDRFVVEVKQETVPYAKDGAKPRVVVSFRTGNGGWRTLTEGRDYTLSCRNHKAVNDGSRADRQPAVIVKGKGNFGGVYGEELHYKIEAQDLGRLTLTAQDRTYRNKRNSFATKLTITDLDGKCLQPGTDYQKVFACFYTEETAVNTAGGGTVVRAAGAAVDKDDIIPAGTVLKVRVTAAEGGNYTGTLEGTYRIVQADIASASVSVQKQIYTGQPVTLEKNQLTVKVKGKELDDSQYEIVPGSYKNNVHKGTASVTVRGVNNYGGTKTVRFTIRPKSFFWWWR